MPQVFAALLGNGEAELAVSIDICCVSAEQQDLGLQGYMELLGVVLANGSPTR